MKDIFWLIKNMLLILIRNKRSSLLIVGLPIAGILFTMLAYGGVGTPTLHVGFVNDDHGRLTIDTIKFIKGLDHVDVEQVGTADVNNKITSGDLDCVIAFDKGFSESIQNGHPIQVRMVSIKGASVTGYIKAYLNNYIDNITSLSKAAKGNKQVFDQMYSQYQHARFKVAASTLDDKSMNKIMTYQTIGYLIMFMLFSAVNLSSMITKDKEKRTYFRLISTPIDSRKYVLANVICNMIIMVFQISLTLLCMTRVFHMGLEIPMWQLFTSLCLFGIVSVGLSLAIISFATNAASGSALQNLIITPSCLLAGCFFPVEIMPRTVQRIAEFLPQHWLLDTIEKLQQGQSFGSLYLNISIMLAFALAFFLIAIYKFGRNDQVRNFI